jgi:hypothetical protein
MSQILASVKQSALVYKMVILYVFLFSVNSLATATVASFLNIDWGSMTKTSKFLVVIVIIQNWTGVLLAFFNRSIQRAESGQAILQANDTPPNAPLTRQAEAPKTGL